MGRRLTIHGCSNNLQTVPPNGWRCSEHTSKHPRRIARPAEESLCPRTANRVIAWLVRQGYLRVILTTNFDRLLEEAIEAEGILEWT